MTSLIIEETPIYVCISLFLIVCVCVHRYRLETIILALTSFPTSFHKHLISRLKGLEKMRVWGHFNIRHTLKYLLSVIAWQMPSSGPEGSCHYHIFSLDVCWLPLHWHNERVKGKQVQQTGCCRMQMSPWTAASADSSSLRLTGKASGQHGAKIPP